MNELCLPPGLIKRIEDLYEEMESAYQAVGRGT